MASAVDIANRALSKLGEVRITSLTDNTKPARAMNARFELLRDAELEAHPWRFSIVRTTLPALATAPAWGFARAFQRPTGDLRPVSIGDRAVNIEAVGVYYQESSGADPHAAPWEVIGDQIHTDLSAPLKYEYISRITDTTLFSALFVEALACRLAADAAEELTQSAGKRDRADAEYARTLREARRINALYRPPTPRGPGNFMLSRFNS